MEETMAAKRQREDEETQVEEWGSEEYSKRQKPYNHILSLLEADEEDPTQDLSPLITTLQQEITASVSDSETLFSSAQENTITSTTATSIASDSSATLKEDEEDDKEKIMRHLLEASDDELGIPNRGEDQYGLMDFGGDGFNNNGSNGFSSLCDGLWELEDETANYYSLLQSELFL
ncbi:hypothetical protein L6164_020772 [Bauhinia variegata]|uniref:Uncharacterized protein n=1 Tax=Bauhinia variegata TaxID=167791 RepID=A0ACB9N156_BAUVA|nr:hypothetical protein L6164_020772 [Bauhinia variegata]